MDSYGRNNQHAKGSKSYRNKGYKVSLENFFLHAFQFFFSSYLPKFRIFAG